MGSNISDKMQCLNQSLSGIRLDSSREDLVVQLMEMCGQIFKPDASAFLLYAGNWRKIESYIIAAGDFDIDEKTVGEIIKHVFTATTGQEQHLFLTSDEVSKITSSHLTTACLILHIGATNQPAGSLVLFFKNSTTPDRESCELGELFTSLVYSTLLNQSLMERTAKQSQLIALTRRKQEVYNDAISNANVRAVNLIAEAETARHEAEIRSIELLEMNEKLEEASRLKSEFLASMSHELRTPLNSIIGFSKILIKGVDGELNSEQMENAQFIQNSGRHLLSIINDILDLSKIEAGKFELNIEEVCIRDLLGEAVDNVHVLFEEKSLSLILELDCGSTKLFIDPVRIKQIIINLLSNAVKFTEKGNVTLKCEIINASNDQLREQIRDTDYETYILISVSDTGCGIKEQDAIHVFEKFRQLDSSSSRKHGGTGLGLSITRKLALLHKGALWFTSNYHHGSTFYLALPINSNQSNSI